MANESLRLWVDSFWISPYAFSCFVTLKEKKLPFEVRTASLPDKEHLKGEYQQRSLTGRVPMLEHADFSLSESSAIVEYLDEAFPGTPRALPGTARDRARARPIMAWGRRDLMPLPGGRPPPRRGGPPPPHHFCGGGGEAALARGGGSGKEARRLRASGGPGSARDALRFRVERSRHGPRIHAAAAQHERLRATCAAAEVRRGAMAVAVGAGVGEARAAPLQAVLERVARRGARKTFAFPPHSASVARRARRRMRGDAGF